MFASCCYQEQQLSEHTCARRIQEDHLDNNHKHHNTTQHNTLTMGAAISRSMAKIFGSKEMRLLMLGLDAAGKTSTSTR